MVHWISLTVSSVIVSSKKLRLVFCWCWLHDIRTMRRAVQDALHFAGGQSQHFRDQRLVYCANFGMGDTNLVIRARDLMDLILLALFFPFDGKTFLGKHILDK